MNRVARIVALVVVATLAGPALAEPVDADRLLKQGFPDRDFTKSRIKLVIAGHRCVLAGSDLKFDEDGGATLTDAACVRVTVVSDREVVEVTAGKSAKVTFDPPVKKAEDLSKSKIVAIETSDGRVIRLK